MRFRPILGAALVLIAVAGCSPIRDTQGYIGETDIIAQLKPGVDTKASVAKTLGRPSLQTQWDDRQWYYITRKTRQYAFRKPRPEDQTVHVFTFDAKGNLLKVDKRGMDQVAAISPEKDKTPTLGKERNFWDDVFGNIGQVGAIGAPGDPGGPPQ